MIVWLIELFSKIKVLKNENSLLNEQKKEKSPVKNKASVFMIVWWWREKEGERERGRRAMLYFPSLSSMFLFSLFFLVAWREKKEKEDYVVSRG